VKTTSYEWPSEREFTTWSGFPFSVLNPIHLRVAPSDQASDLKAKPFGQEEFLTSVAPLILRLALAVTILSAVAEPFGIWDPLGATNVAWGDWPHFVAYTAKVNRFLPEVFAPALAVTVTGAEGLLGLALILGIFPRPTAWASAALLGLFAVAMTLSLGIKASLNYSVFADAAAAFVLGAWPVAARSKSAPPRRR
jgi:putative oxidoreductase